MKKLLGSLAVFTLCVGFIGIANVFALDFGDEITIMDNAGTGTGWYSKAKEDQEVEKNCVATQPWDLEGFFLDGTKLTMVGGYDFLNGYHDIYSGDIFLDVDGDIVYGQDVTTLSGNGNKGITNEFGYDYVLDLNFDTLSYDVYQIDSSASLISPYYRQNDTSGAWKYESGGTLLTSGTIDYLAGLSDADTGFAGGAHNAASVDLGFIASSTDFTAHFTMGCGNDDLMGQGHLDVPPTPTPEPGTLLLLGFGVFGLVGVARKRIV